MEAMAVMDKNAKLVLQELMTGEPSPAPSETMSLTRRLSSKKLRQLARSSSAEGWQAALAKGGHVLHPQAASPVFSSSASGDRRSWRNLRSALRRALRQP